MNEQGRSFYEQARDARRLLVLDLGFLGDSVHLIPALHEIRRAWPDAQLDVMAETRARQILQIVPGLDNVLGYPRFPKGPKWYENFGYVKDLRARQYDAVINLNGSDRSSILTWASGAKWRLGRVPPKQSAFWPHCFTHTVDVPHGGRPVFVQRWECLPAAGIPVSVAPEFAVTLPAEVVAAVDEKLDGEHGYLHISPCTTQDQKELPMEELAKLVAALIADKSGPKVVISCAPNEREKGKVAELLKRLPEPPWRVFAGELSLLELAETMGRASRHFGGDSGALHLALMMNTPTVSWFRDYEGKDEWLPPGDQHRTVLGQESPNGLQGLSAEQLLRAYREV
ncbi:glycosyltransferase family 9 protein [Cerasicoccus fimbriatus]|uniref:glycosyltransferase family 9 protein n=1 Tax=Cerasicoccus fimbriatus TaxID=3014554 RepID=UPI0022B5C613|nr:glycosyltransferase family 9 protein [Cerasicoccus sp. TK19100]